MATSDQIYQSLITMCRDNQIIPADVDIGRDDDIFEYGILDSMGLTILAFAIEDHFGLPISQDMLIAELRTPGDIAAYIAENSTESAAALPVS
ncbi:MAG: acyl carrier protein [Gammaproteobacteria bacterium]|jgi:acyl carrier protein